MINALWFLAFASCLFAAAARENATAPTPLLRSHAHNDYEHQRPLFDALEHGFCSIEPDIHLVNGRLLVAHDLSDARPERTLQSLYLEPLRERVRQNGGRVYRDGPTITLLIDVKSDAERTYVVLRGVLQQYASMLTKFYPEKTETNAIMVILSGNRARRMMTEETVRYAAYDGRLEDLDSPGNHHFIPLISDQWSRFFKWNGAGPVPPEEKQKLGEVVAKAHQQKRRVRLWGTPDLPAVWSLLLAAGVDLINTDDLPGLEKFLLTKQNLP